MITKILQLFSPYANPFEKKVDKFFKKIKSTSNKFTVQKELEKLMQKDLVVLDLWMEKKYKNYKYMSKSVRRKMYANVKELNKEFDQYAEATQLNEASISARLEARGLSFPKHKKAQIKYLALMMSYLTPGKHYKYQEAANFGRLLKNPREEKLIGDCNQIVTLYSYLFSRKFPITELKIKLLPKHVCLHFEGIDIEATNATFQKYDDHEGVLPITELISTNLLDVNDATEETRSIDPRTMVKRAQFALKISSMKEIVQRNLEVAYRNVGITLMKQKKFKSAIFFFEKLGDRELLASVHHNASVEAIQAKDFKKALYYAKRKGDDKLIKSVISAKGAHYYNAGNYSEALKCYRKIKDEKMVKACYRGQYSQLAKKVRNVKTVSDAKKHRSKYQKMLSLAQKMGDDKAVTYVKSVLGKM